MTPSPAQPGLTPLTVTGIRRLFAELISTTTPPARFRLAWSRWRRIRKAQARTSNEPAPGSTRAEPVIRSPWLSHLTGNATC